MKFLGEVGRGPTNSPLDFGGDPVLLPYFAPIFHTRNAISVE